MFSPNTSGWFFLRSSGPEVAELSPNWIIPADCSVHPIMAQYMSVYASERFNYFRFSVFLRCARRFQVDMSLRSSIFSI